MRFCRGIGGGGIIYNSFGDDLVILSMIDCLV